MLLRTRKLVVASVTAAVLFLANALVIATWLDDSGVVGWVRYIREEYATGTAITVIVVLLFLLGSPVRKALIRRCGVCDHFLLRPGGYCGACGSRL